MTSLAPVTTRVLFTVLILTGVSHAAAGQDVSTTTAAQEIVQLRAELAELRAEIDALKQSSLDAWDPETPEHPRAHNRHPPTRGSRCCRRS